MGKSYRGFSKPAPVLNRTSVPEFDFDYATRLRADHPDIWGNNDQPYQQWLANRAAPSDAYIREQRQRWESCRSYNQVGGYLYLLRHGLVADCGLDAMIAAIDQLKGQTADQLYRSIGYASNSLPVPEERKMPAITSGTAGAAPILGRHVRAADSDNANFQIDVERRTVTMPFSSSHPVQRFSYEFWDYYDEVLGHDPGESNLDRMNAGGAYLWAHDTTDQRGVVESAWVDGERAYCTARFSKNLKGEELWADVQDGICRNVSFAYYVNESILVKVVDDYPTYRATSWEVLEVSSVSIPADPTVGVGRELSFAREAAPTPVIIQETKKMDENAVIDQVNAQDIEARIQMERERVLTIQEVCQRQNISQSVYQRWIDQGTPLNQFLTELRNELPKTIPLSQPTIDLTEKERQRYSIGKAILAVYKNDFSNAGFERELSQEISKRSGLSTDGLLVPDNLNMAATTRNQLVGTPLVGGNIVETAYTPSLYINMLRNTAMCLALGVTVIEGLTTNLSIPYQSAFGALPTPVAENTAYAKSQLEFLLYSMSPKKRGRIYKFSEEMAILGNPSIDALIMSDMMTAMSLAIDSDILYGTGTAGQPRGIANTAGINAQAIGANGGAPTWDLIVDQETATNVQNSMFQSSAYLVNGKTLGTLKKTLKGPNTGGIYLVDGQPIPNTNLLSLNGHRLAFSNQVLGNRTKGTGTNLSDMFFGDFSQVLLGFWKGVEITKSDSNVDDFEKDMYTVKVCSMYDTLLRRPASFSLCSDIA